MANDRPLDPTHLMQAFLSGWNRERSTEAPSPQPAGSGNVDANEPLAMRLMAQALALANMPSREEIGAIADRLDRIEALLSGLACRLDQLEASRLEEHQPVKKRKKKG